MTDQDTTDARTTKLTVLASARSKLMKARATGRADTLGEAPLLALAGGIAAGALIAALLPRTESRERADPPDGTAREGHAPGPPSSAAKDAGTQRLDELGLTREKGEETIRSLLDGVDRSREGLGERGARCRAQVRQELTPRGKSASERAMSKLHLVFGGRVKDPRGLDFDLEHDRPGRPLRQLCRRRGRLARQGPAHGRRCRDEICRRPPPPAARAGQEGSIAGIERPRQPAA